MSVDVNQEGVTTCPYCADSVSTVVPIEPGMKLRLQENAGIAAPDMVCNGCFAMMSKLISKGAALRAEATAKEQNRLLLWKNRVSLIKKAKQHMAQKSFSDAAVSFEKYLRVLEIVYDLKAGDLKPDLFKDQKRSQEMTVIASVYWDLMRVYDTNSRYAERQMKAAAKLAEFVRFTPIFPHIMKKAEIQTRKAKNPEAYRKFLKLSNSNRPRCFIATAAFEGTRTPTVDVLCRFRDQKLKPHPLGRRFIATYYRTSPTIAKMIDAHPLVKPAMRTLLTWPRIGNS